MRSVSEQEGNMIHIHAVILKKPQNFIVYQYKSISPQPTYKHNKKIILQIWPC